MKSFICIKGNNLGVAQFTTHFPYEGDESVIYDDDGRAFRLSNLIACEGFSNDKIFTTINKDLVFAEVDESISSIEETASDLEEEDFMFICYDTSSPCFSYDKVYKVRNHSFEDDFGNVYHVSNLKELASHLSDSKFTSVLLV